MAEQHDHTHEQGTEREIIVTDRGGGGAGAAIAVVIAVLLAILIGWLFFFGGPLADGDDTVVDVPEEINVDVEDGGGDTTG